LSTSGVTTDATTSTDQDASATVSDTTTTQTDASPGSGAVGYEADVASLVDGWLGSSSTTPADDIVRLCGTRRGRPPRSRLGGRGRFPHGGPQGPSCCRDRHDACEEPSPAGLRCPQSATGASVNARGSVYGTYVLRDQRGWPRGGARPRAGGAGSTSVNGTRAKH